MDIVEKIETMISPSLQAMGYDIVQLKLLEGKRKTLSLMAERQDLVRMSFDDCTEISRTVSALLDVEDVIASAYDLEVCSPGIDRPLTKFADYERFLGGEVKLETLIPMVGRKRFRGVIKAAKNNNIALECDEGVYDIAFHNIRNAKMVEATLKKGTKRDLGNKKMKK